MTSLIAWVGYDGKRPATIYLASDSRLTWPDGSTWDHGRKLFASQTRPDILAYCGEVLFPSQVLGQVIAAIDGGVLDECKSSSDKLETVRTLIEHAFAGYPPKCRAGFDVLYCTRTGSGARSEMECFEMTATGRGNAVTALAVPIPAASGIVAVRGTGSTAVKKWTAYWLNSGQAGGTTSRGAFCGFCDAVVSSEDRQSGGAVQLVGLFRKGEAKTFGVSLYGTAFIHGLTLGNATLARIDWRNELFERCNQAGQRLQTAQRQPRPRDIPVP